MKKLLFILTLLIGLNAQSQQFFMMLKETPTSSFVPTDIASIRLWYKADGLTGLVDGDPVSSMTDFSGQSNHGTASTTARPTYKTNIINGKPIIRFDGTANFLTLTTGIASAAPYTVFFVYKKRVSGGLFFTLLASNQTSCYTAFDYSDGNFYAFTQNNSYTQSTGTGNNTSAFVTISHIGVGSNHDTAWKNGTNINLVNQSGTGTSSNFNEVGRRSADGLFADGDLAELIYYNTNLNLTQRQQVEAYLRTKYAHY